jgi:hypothetical protein
MRVALEKRAGLDADHLTSATNTHTFAANVISHSSPFVDMRKVQTGLASVTVLQLPATSFSSSHDNSCIYEQYQ